MQLFISLLAAGAVVKGHYTFPSMIAPGVTADTEWTNVRKTKDWQSNGPVTDVMSDDIRCNQLTPGGSNATTASVKSGDTIGFAAKPDIYHPGPVQLYMAKVPAGQTAASFDGSGQVWFKIYEEQPNFGAQLTWPSNSEKEVTIKVPECLSPGDYLFRIEHIGLHVAQSIGGAQFYISCGQLTVAGGGSTQPTETVAFPGAYNASDPGILININYPVPTSYKNPGPSVFSC